MYIGGDGQMEALAQDNIYKRAFEMFVDEMGECSMCPLNKKLLLQHGWCDKDGQCAKIITRHWIEKAKGE